jgi:Helix-turn-helix domain
MSDVWRLDLPTTEKMVLLVIADHANDEGTEAWPSQATIATKASISIRTVQRCVNNLVTNKYLKMEKHAGGSASCRDDRRPHRYTINLKMLRGDKLTGRQKKQRGDIESSDEATLTPITGRQSRPMNHPIKSPLETPDLFSQFWEIYPRQEGIKPARIAWATAIEIADPLVIIEAVKNYAQDPNRVPRYTFAPATYLSEERWLDKPLAPFGVDPALVGKTLAEQKSEAVREEKARLEKEKSARIARELQDAKAQAVPAPDFVKELRANLKRVE